MLDFYNTKKSPCDTANYEVFLKAFFKCIHNWIFYDYPGVILPNGTRVSFTIGVEGNTIYIYIIYIYIYLNIIISISL